MMRIFTMIFGLAALSASAQKQAYEVSGTARNAKNGAYLYIVDRTTPETRTDSARIENGTFKFSGTTAGVSQLSLYNNRAKEHFEGGWNEIYAEPGKLSLAIDYANLDDLKLTGSKSQDDYVALKAQLQSIYKRRDSLSVANAPLQKREHMERNKDSVKVIKAKLAAASDFFEKLRNEEISTELKFLNAHPDSNIAPGVLSMRFGQIAGQERMPELVATWNRLSARVKQSEAGTELGKRIKALEAASAGKPAPGFSVKDRDGKTLSLSDFKDKKYVLIEFWASWCAPCRAEFPELKKLGAKYRAKGLEIVAFSQDENLASWGNSVDREGINAWKHVALAQNQNVPVKENYAVTFIPVKFLVDKKGTIVARWNGSGEETTKAIAQKLEELLGK